MSLLHQARFKAGFQIFIMMVSSIALILGAFPVLVHAGDSPPPGFDRQQPVRLAAGRMHSALILQDGALYLWGDNTYGQLGISGIDYLDAPGRVILPAKAVDVSLGSDHTLVLTEDGSVYAMGRNTFGQLGNQTTVLSDRPVKVEGLPPVQAVAAGAWHSLALGRDGSVWGWGDNSNWQLGESQGEAIKNTTGNIVGYRQTRPVAIVLARATGIAAGAQFSLYLHQDGQLYAWGDNSRGQLGDGTVQTRSRPTAVVGLTSVRQVSAGYQHVLAIAADQDTGSEALYAWGDHSSGQLGLAGIPAGDAMQALPQRVDATRDNDPAGNRIEDPAYNRIALVSAGYAHSVVVVSSINTTGQPDSGRYQVLVWGDNSHGQLSLGHHRNQTVPQAVSGTFNGFTGDDFLPFTAVAAGGFHTLLMSSKGLLAASGRGDRGQLGTESIVNRFVFSVVSIPDQIRPGWLEHAALSITRHEDGQIVLRWPAAQDNIGVAGYRILLRWSDGTSYSEDISLRQQWILSDPAVLAGKEILAMQAGIFVFDAAGRNLSWPDMSRLAGFLAPADHPDAQAEDYFAEAMDPLHLIGSDRHAWRPTGSGLLQPLEVPWDVAPIYGSGRLPEPPSYRLLLILSLATAVLLFISLFILMRTWMRKIQNSKQQKERASRLHLSVRRIS